MSLVSNPEHQFSDAEIEASLTNDNIGGSKHQARILEEEQQLEEYLTQRQSLENSFAPTASPATSVSSNVVIDMVSGDVIDLSGEPGALEDEITIAAILDMFARGVGDEEIEQMLNAQLNSISARIVRDKGKAKKYLAHLLEVLSTLEIALREQGRNPELQASLRQLQEKLSNLIKQNNPLLIQEFLRSQMLRDTLAQATKLSRDSVDLIRAIQTALRNVARDAALIQRQNQSLNEQTQKAQIDTLQNALKLMRGTYDQLAKDLKAETNPDKQQELLKSLKELVENAKLLNSQLQRVQQDPSARISKQALDAINSAVKMAQQLASRNSTINDMLNALLRSQQVMQRLMSQQQQTLTVANLQELLAARLRMQLQEMMNSRVAADFTVERGGRIDVLPFDRATGLNLAAQNQQQGLDTALLSRLANNQNVIDFTSRLNQQQQQMVADLSPVQQQAVLNMSREQQQAVLSMRPEQQQAVLNMQQSQQQAVLAMRPEQQQAILSLTAQQQQAFLSMLPAQQQAFLQMDATRQQAVLNMTREQQQSFLNMSREQQQAVMNLSPAQQQELMRHSLNEISQQLKDNPNLRDSRETVARNDNHNEKVADIRERANEQARKEQVRENETVTKKTAPEEQHRPTDKRTPDEDLRKLALENLAELEGNPTNPDLNPDQKPDPVAKDPCKPCKKTCCGGGDVTPTTRTTPTPEEVERRHKEVGETSPKELPKAEDITEQDKVNLDNIIKRINENQPPKENETGPEEHPKGERPPEVEDLDNLLDELLPKTDPEVKSAESQEQQQTQANAR